MPAHTSLTPITGDCPTSVGAGGLEQRGQRGGFWSHSLGRTSARPPPPAASGQWLHLPASHLLQLGTEAEPAHGLQEGVMASLHASAVAFVSWKSCGEAEGWGRGTGRGWPAGPSGRESPAPTGEGKGQGAASGRSPSPALAAGPHVVLERAAPPRASSPAFRNQGDVNTAVHPEPRTQPGTQGHLTGKKVSLGTSGRSPKAECPAGGRAALRPGCPPLESYNYPLTLCPKHLHVPPRSLPRPHGPGLASSQPGTCRDARGLWWSESAPELGPP